MPSTSATVSPTLLGCGASCPQVPRPSHHSLSRKKLSALISVRMLVSASSNASASTPSCVSLSVSASVLCYRVCQRFDNCLGLHIAKCRISCSVPAFALASSWLSVSARISKYCCGLHIGHCVASCLRVYFVFTCDSLSARVPSSARPPHIPVYRPLSRLLPLLAVPPACPPVSWRLVIAQCVATSLGL